jgi:predicted DNA-binding WGR domain protein
MAFALASPPMPRYELSEGTSNKFWQIDLNGSSFTTTFGRIGSAGQSSTKTYDSDAKALSEYNKLIAEKTKKGYQLVGGASVAAAGTPTPRPAKPATPATTPAAAAPAKPTPAPEPPPAHAAATPPPQPGEPSVDVSDALRSAAQQELRRFEITRKRAEGAGTKWSIMLYRPFTEGGKALVQSSAGRGEPESQRLSNAVLRTYGSLETMPATLEVETAAAMLQLTNSACRQEVTEALVEFWVAHSGLAFAIEAFARSQWSWAAGAYSQWSRNDGVYLREATERTLEDRFGRRTDRLIQAAWLGATDDERETARTRVEQLRADGSLLERSAIASCVLDTAWIDADLRDYANTGEPAMFSPEALLRAQNAAHIATYLTKLGTHDVELFRAVKARWAADRPLLEGYHFVVRLGLGGIDIAVARARSELASWNPNGYGAIQLAAVSELLAVARHAREYPPVVELAIEVLDQLDDKKLSKEEDPRPAAYTCLRASPALALSLLQPHARKGWVKTLLPQLERIVSGGSDDRPDAPYEAVPAAMRSSGKFKAPEFWNPDALPRIAFTDGTLFPRTALDGLASALKAPDRIAIEELEQRADASSLAAFGWELFQSWLTSGAPSKDKWAFTALGLVGDDETARRITPLIRAWPGESQHQRAVLGLDVLGEIGSDVALMMLNGIAQKVKFKGLQEKARAKMDEIAAKRGMTAEQLADRLVPDLDLEDDGSKTLDFGPRSFRVGFDEALGPFVLDATGTRLKDLPKPNSKDDPTLSAQATETWKAMKKDVRALASIQILRLELGMGNARRWSGEEFRNFFVEHPLLTHLVRRLVWGVYAPDGTLQRTFRVAEDRSYADHDDDACEVAADAVIGIAHRLHLSDDDTAAWGKLFADYELAQPFEQLARATYRLSADERKATKIARLENRKVETKKLLGLLSRGWRKGHAQDAGQIYEFMKVIRPGLIASVSFSDGINAGGMDYVDAHQTLGEIDFAPTEPSWGTRAGTLELAAVDEVTLSEVIRDIESIGQVEA